MGGTKGAVACSFGGWLEDVCRAGLDRGWQGPLAMVCIILGPWLPITSISKLGLPLSEPAMQATRQTHRRDRRSVGCSGASRSLPPRQLGRETGIAIKGAGGLEIYHRRRREAKAEARGAASRL